MAQVRLNRPRVGWTIGQVIATGVSQLMWMHRKWDLRQLPSPLNDVPHYGVRERAAALGDEYPAAIRVLLLQFPPPLGRCFVLLTRFFFDGRALIVSPTIRELSSLRRSSSRSWSLVVGIGVVWPTDSHP